MKWLMDRIGYGVLAASLAGLAACSQPAVHTLVTIADATDSPAHVIDTGEPGGESRVASDKPHSSATRPFGRKGRWARANKPLYGQTASRSGTAGTCPPIAAVTAAAARLTMTPISCILTSEIRGLGPEMEIAASGSECSL